MLFTPILIQLVHGNFQLASLTHHMMFCGTLVVAVAIVVDVLWQEDVDVDASLCSFADTFHGFVQAVAQQFLSDAHTTHGRFYEWKEKWRKKGKPAYNYMSKSWQ